MIKEGQQISRTVQVRKQVSENLWQLETTTGKILTATTKELNSRLQAAAIATKLIRCKQMRFVFNQEVKSLYEWAIEYKHSPWTVLNRIESGLSIEQALLLPAGQQFLYSNTGKYLHLPNSAGQALCKPSSSDLYQRVKPVVDQKVCGKCIQAQKSWLRKEDEWIVRSKQVVPTHNVNLKQFGELLIDLEALSQLQAIQFVFRRHELISDCWDAYIFPELETPVVKDIVTSVAGGFKWNCYEGAESKSRSDVARLVIASLS